MNYKKLSKKPKTFHRITGLTILEFNKILPFFEKEWDNYQNSKIRNAKPHLILKLEDKLLCILIYYKCYITHMFLGCLFGVVDSTITRLFQKIEPMLVKKIHIKRTIKTIERDKRLTPDKVLEILVDCTEIDIQRPKDKKKQKQNYSGKKKKHTKKCEAITDKNTGEILEISKIFLGKDHDKKIRDSKGSVRIPDNEFIKIEADSGYQGIQQLYQKTKVKLPIKRRKNKKLTKEEKSYNRELSSTRVRIEHSFGKIKRFNILSHKYRNFGKKLNLRMNIIAGLVNLKGGFLNI